MVGANTKASAPIAIQFWMGIAIAQAHAIPSLTAVMNVSFAQNVIITGLHGKTAPLTTITLHTTAVRFIIPALIAAC